MLKRLYANNYRCLINFEIRFDDITLLMGPNGGGKSTLFDLIAKIRSLVVDTVKIGELFRAEDLTAWIQQPEQGFELDVALEEGLFSYRIHLSHDQDIKKQRIALEQLMLDEKPLFEFKKGEVQLYHDDHTTGPTYSFDWSVSALATISPRSDNKKLTRFKAWMEKVLVLSLQPKAMRSESASEHSDLSQDGANFSSWYRYLSQEHQDKVFQLTDQLRRSIPGFYAFKLMEAGKHKILKAGFGNEESNASPIFFDFEQLSDGQRVLIVLYTLLLGLTDLGHTVFLDEPENYVALVEIQPWLMELRDACGGGGAQAVLVSHHPELIDYFGVESSQWMERDPLGPARVKKLPERMDDPLKLSERIARGWIE